MSGSLEGRVVIVTGGAQGIGNAIAKGLAAGERVVTDGHLRLVPGARVDVKPSGPARAPTTSPAAAPAAAPAPALVLRPMRPREELFVVRSACGGDVRALCGRVAPGGGRIARCLATQAASLSPACKEVLAQFAAQ